MSTVLDQVRRYQYAIEKHPEDEHRLLRCIERLQQLDVTVRHLEETGVGRTVNALRKEPGAIGEAARALVKQWKYMVAAEERSEPEDYNSEVTASYNGHHNGNDPNGRQNSTRSESSRDCDKSQYHNGNYTSDNKRKLEGSKEETSETKRSRHSNHVDYHKVNEKMEESSDNDDSSSGSSDSESEDSETDMSNYRETIVKRELKCEPETSSKRHEERKSDSSNRSKESTHKLHKSESKRSSDKSSSSSHKENDKEKHKSSKQRSEKYNKEKEIRRTHEDKSESTSSKDKDRHRHSSEKEKHKKSHKSSKERSDNERHKERSTSSKEKSSHSHTEKNEKRHSSSDKKKTSENKGKSDSHKEKESSSRSSHKSSSSSKSSSSKLRDNMPKKPKSQYSEDSEDGIDCGSGASFAEALGMISPSKPKKKSINKDTSPATYSITHDMTPSALLAPMAKLAPLPPIEITALPEISPNYKPMPPPRLLPHINEEDAMNAVISSKNQRTKVYSGNKTVGKVYTLYELCVQVLQEHIESLEYTGGVPYEILKPIVDRATPEQLFMLEHYNPYLMEDTDHLWQGHCQKRFRTKQRQEMETWREMYMRCQEEQEYKLKSLTANIKMAQEVKNAPVKQTKMAYVDTVVKPPRNIARKQAIHGTARAAAASPAARVASLATVCTGSTRMAHIANNASATAGAIFKPKKAPLMQKALQFMRGRKR